MDGGAGDCPYTCMKDLVWGRYKQAEHYETAVKDGTGCGFERSGGEFVSEVE